MSPRNWIAVASAEHVRIGVAHGFMQVCHGKAAPLCRLSPGDRVAYYAPTVSFRGTDTLQAFTALGIVAPGQAYCIEMEGGFRPFRRNMLWADVRPAPIRPLLGALAFAREGRSWGHRFRFGLFEIGAADMQVLADAMAAPAWNAIPATGRGAAAAGLDPRQGPTPARPCALTAA